MLKQSRTEGSERLATRKWPTEYLRLNPACIAQDVEAIPKADRMVRLPRHRHEVDTNPADSPRIHHGVRAS